MTRISLHSKDLTKERLLELSDEDLIALNWAVSWRTKARPKQMAPVGDWTIWGVLAGRGFGKTLTGAQWLGWEAYWDKQALPRAVIAPTFNDVRHTCFEGPAGLLKVIPHQLIDDYNKSNLIITLTNGSTIRGFSAEEPERLRGPQHVDIWCFIAGTMVATPNGDRPIETIKPGDMVLTRHGPQRVMANGKRGPIDVGKVTFSTGAELIGTADHMVHTSYGWTRMDSLTKDHELCAIAASSGVEKSGTVTETVTTNERINLLGQREHSGFIEKYGLLILGPFQTATMFITKTATKVTTGLKTFAASFLMSIRRITSEKQDQRLKIGLNKNSLLSSAPTAELILSESKLLGRQDAQAAINDGLMKKEKNSAYAPTAEQSFSRVVETFAASVASTWQPLGEQFVYCLQVHGDPEYFANGILVHNCDELAAWQYLQETWDMAMMGLRLGAHPRILFTTTPKPRDLIRNLIDTKGAVIVRGSTYENRANLPKTFFDQLAQYEGTQLGRQELDGELIDPEESGIIKRSWMKLWPSKKPLPSFEWIVMSLDTAFTEATTDRKTHEADCSACTVWGTFFHENKANVMLLDAWQDRLGLPDLITRVKKELNVAYGDDKDAALIKPMFGSSKLATSGRKPDILIIEDKGSGISLRQMLEREGIEAYAYNPGRADKLTRLHMVSSVFARNQVWLPESGKYPNRPMTWCNDMLDQLCTFTGSGSIKHDDYVDSVTQAVRLMMDKNLLSAVKKSNLEYDRPPSRPVINPYAS